MVSWYRSWEMVRKLEAKWKLADWNSYFGFSVFSLPLGCVFVDSINPWTLLQTTSWMLRKLFLKLLMTEVEVQPQENNWKTKKLDANSESLNRPNHLLPWKEFVKSTALCKDFTILILTLTCFFPSLYLCRFMYQTILATQSLFCFWMLYALVYEDQQSSLVCLENCMCAPTFFLTLWQCFHSMLTLYGAKLRRHTLTKSLFYKSAPSTPYILHLIDLMPFLSLSPLVVSRSIRFIFNQSQL